MTLTATVNKHSQNATFARKYSRKMRASIAFGNGMVLSNVRRSYLGTGDHFEKARDSHIASILVVETREMRVRSLGLSVVENW